jgi:hypothetical protein
MKHQTKAILVSALLRILRQITRVLLRNGIAYPEFEEYARRAFAQVAWEDFRVDGRKPSVSRVAVVSGLNRKEVKRLLETPPDAAMGEEQRYNRAARVVTGWLRDTEYRGIDGQPRALSLDDPDRGFPALVRRYSGDMPTRAVLDELVRVGTVRVDGGVAVLMQRSYAPKGDDGQGLHILGTDVSDLIATIDFNLQSDGPTRFQQKVSYDNVPEEALPAWRAYAAEHSLALLESLDRRLSISDRDANPEIEGTGRVRTGVGIFYFEEPHHPEPHGKEEKH